MFKFFLLKYWFNDLFVDFNCYNSFDCYWRSLNINCCLEVCLVSAGYQSVAVSYLVPYHRHVSLLCWIKTIATWKKWLKVCSLKEWTIIERHLPDFSLSILAILLDIRDGETLAKWPSRASIATHPSTDTEWSPKLLTRFSTEGLNYTMIYRRARIASKCEPLLRFNPLNLANIACFTKWVKGLSVFPRIFYTKKVSMILTCIILKIKVQLT